MKIYRKVVLDPDGKIIFEDSYEYSGPVALCKGGGGGQAEAKEASDKAFKLQKEMFEFQKQQTLKLEQDTESEEAKAAALKQRQLDINRQGRASTLKTVEQKTRFDTFDAKFQADKPLNVPGLVDVNDDLKSRFRTEAEEEFKGIKDERSGFLAKKASEAKSLKIEESISRRIKEAEASNASKTKAAKEALTKLSRAAHAKVQPFTRKSLGTPKVVKRRLSAGKS